MKIKIVNLTQHPASAEQLKEGVINLPNYSVLRNALTFNGLPTKEAIQNRAELITGWLLKRGLLTP